MKQDFTLENLADYCRQYLQWYERQKT